MQDAEKNGGLGQVRYYLRLANFGAHWYTMSSQLQFSDLSFKPDTHQPGNHEGARLDFDNGWSVTVIHGKFVSQGATDAPYEVGVWLPAVDPTGPMEVYGRRTASQVEKLINLVRELPANHGITSRKAFDDSDWTWKIDVV